MQCEEKVGIDMFILTTGRCPDPLKSFGDWKICTHNYFIKKRKERTQEHRIPCYYP